MAIAFDNATDSGAQNGSPFTFSHTTGNGSNRLLLLFIHNTTGTNDNPSSVTYDGVAMTQLGTTNGNGWTESIWYLANPNSGAKTVSVTSTNSNFSYCTAISFTGCSGVVDNYTTNIQIGSNNSCTMNVSSATGNVVVDGIIIHSGSHTLSVTGGQTIELGGLAQPANPARSVSFLAGAATTTMSWSWDGTAQTSNQIGCEIVAAPNVVFT